MKNPASLKLANREAYSDFINKAMENGHVISYTKGKILGYVREINVKATCLTTGEEMRMIWVEEN